MPRMMARALNVTLITSVDPGKTCGIVQYDCAQRRVVKARSFELCPPRQTLAVDGLVRNLLRALSEFQAADVIVVEKQIMARHNIAVEAALHSIAPGQCVSIDRKSVIKRFPFLSGHDGYASKNRANKVASQKALRKIVCSDANPFDGVMSPSDFVKGKRVHDIADAFWMALHVANMRNRGRIVIRASSPKKMRKKARRMRVRKT